MKRSDFLKKLGIVLGAGIVVPQALIPKDSVIDLKPIIVKKFDSISVTKEYPSMNKSLLSHLVEENKTFYTSAYSLADFDEVWREYIKQSLTDQSIYFIL